MEKIAVTRFNEETWKQHCIWKNSRQYYGSIYNTPTKISPKILPNSILFVIEMNNSLNKISETHAQSFILDISGVAVVDTAVANHLIKITKATKLMGCECIISGVSPAIAQTIVELGIDIGTIKTTPDMKAALESSFKQMGMEIRNAS